MQRQRSSDSRAVIERLTAHRSAALNAELLERPDVALEGPGLCRNRRLLTLYCRRIIRGLCDAGECQGEKHRIVNRGVVHRSKSPRNNGADSR